MPTGQEAGRLDVRLHVLSLVRGTSSGRGAWGRATSVLVPCSRDWKDRAPRELPEAPTRRHVCPGASVQFSKHVLNTSGVPGTREGLGYKEVSCLWESANPLRLGVYHSYVYLPRACPMVCWAHTNVPTGRGEAGAGHLPSIPQPGMWRAEQGCPCSDVLMRVAWSLSVDALLGASGNMRSRLLGRSCA